MDSHSQQCQLNNNFQTITNWTIQFLFIEHARLEKTHKQFLVISLVSFLKLFYFLVLFDLFGYFLLSDHLDKVQNTNFRIFFFSII